MAKSSAERKAAQRARQSAAGNRKILSGHIKSISKRLCGKCGESLPITSCPCVGDSQCWVTRGWHETKLSA
ncbi:hypothetical protein [Klebsiella variicola]|uniref:hypothetical protein n=1 Tax=Klebsiella variicola TaxID=244366 RepID=UPI0035A25753